MKITWYGHAAFAVESTVGTKVILDPYNYPDCGGYLAIDEPADVVCVSHDNPAYHSDISSIHPPFEHIEALKFVGGSREAAGIRFDAHEVYETPDGEGPNAMVKFTMDGVTVGHQGDLGHALEGDALDFLRGVDVLLALAGDGPTIALPDLVEVIRATQPSYVIPMHYGTARVNLNLLPVSEFMKLCADEFAVEEPGQPTLEVTQETLSDKPRIVVLDHAR